MSERQPGLYDSVARKWHALVERRRTHLTELRETGRWRHYYTWDELLEAMREAAGTSGTWARLAGIDQGEARSAEFATAATPTISSNRSHCSRPVSARSRKVEAGFRNHAPTKRVDHDATELPTSWSTVALR
jgi:uncharacterized repeat protein (TIGR03809 family)